MMGNTQISFTRSLRTSVPPVTPARLSSVQNRLILGRNFAQNKANLQEGMLVITGFRERRYVKAYGSRLQQEQSQFRQRRLASARRGICRDAKLLRLGGVNTNGPARKTKPILRQGSAVRCRLAVTEARDKRLVFCRRLWEHGGVAKVGLGAKAVESRETVCMAHLRRFNGSSKRVPHA